VRLNEDYSEWPDDPVQRRQMAREVLGRDLVLVRDTMIKRVEAMLFQNTRAKRPTPEQRTIEEWMDHLSSEERDIVLSFAKFVAGSAISVLVNRLDGAKAGSWIHPAYTEYRLALAVFKDVNTWPDADPAEVIELTSEEDGFFHDAWPQWVDRYSECVAP
jgi:hypothetical protein